MREVALFLFFIVYIFTACIYSGESLLEIPCLIASIQNVLDCECSLHDPLSQQPFNSPWAWVIII